MNPIAVSALAKYIKKTLDVDYFLADLAVEGEISNLKNYPNGHCYFTLKDQDAAISCILYRWDKGEEGFSFQEGDQVVVRGGVSVYEKETRINFYVQEIEEKGLGSLYKDYLKTKDKLEKEGLFREDLKKPIPAYVDHIGVVTSKQGAVIEDIIHVTRRRNQGVSITLYPCQVQGQGAEKTIKKALARALENKDLDVIILGRGGGSFEDLMAFQDEDLARMIFQADIPIISAVGHETDYSISDFVADLRAPTPSAGAELAVTLKEDLVMDLDLKIRRAQQKFYQRIQGERTQLNRREGALRLYSLDLLVDRKKLDLANRIFQVDMALKRKVQEDKTALNHRKAQGRLLLERRLAGEKRRLDQEKLILERNFSPSQGKRLLERRGLVLGDFIKGLKQKINYENQGLAYRKKSLRALGPRESLKKKKVNLAYQGHKSQVLMMKKIQGEKTDLLGKGKFLKKWSQAFPRTYVLKDGQFVGGIGDLKKEDLLKLYLVDGQAHVRVEEVYKKEGGKE